MDRFIDFLTFHFVSECQNLKSNMDRFIDIKKSSYNFVTKI